MHTLTLLMHDIDFINEGSKVYLHVRLSWRTPQSASYHCSWRHSTERLINRNITRIALTSLFGTLCELSQNIIVPNLNFESYLLRTSCLVVLWLKTRKNHLIFGGSSLITRYSGHSSPFLELLKMATPSVLRLSEILFGLSRKPCWTCLWYSEPSYMSRSFPSFGLLLSFKIWRLISGSKMWLLKKKRL